MAFLTAYNELNLVLEEEGLEAVALKGEGINVSEMDLYCFQVRQVCHRIAGPASLAAGRRWPSCGKSRWYMLRVFLLDFKWSLQLECIS